MGFDNNSFIFGACCGFLYVLIAEVLEDLHSYFKEKRRKNIDNK